MKYLKWAGLVLLFVVLVGVGVWYTLFGPVPDYGRKVLVFSKTEEYRHESIAAGGGFVGIHAAADTEWRDNGWHWYTRLVGAAFDSHPQQPNV